MPYKLIPDIPDKLIESYLKESEIAVDTELHGLRLFRDEVCLVQICDKIIILQYFTTNNSSI